ncbi:hypothetical protein SFRURICE_020328 [Spodoptera frugiperda]|nr:hypothetical protein SFRURICE_020328 [Spodoptera frugiperda]
MKKGKGKKKQKNKRSVALNPINVMMTDLPPVLSHGPQSSPLEAVTETWATVVRKNNPHKNTQPKVPAAPSTTQKKGRTIVLPKIPTTAAIAITITEGSSATYAETMYKARQRIKLSEFGIESFNQRIGMTGGMLLEISGADCNAKADKLAARMREVLADIDVRITRPCKMGEIIILDVDESISPVDVVTAVAEVGGCSPDDVKVGVIRRQPHSLGRVWVRCPLATNLDMYVISVRVEWTEAINVMLAPNTVIKQMNAQRKHIDALFVRTWDTKLTTEWAPKIVLLLRKKGQKVGSVPTCVRWQGESVVDLSWATASACRMVANWRVAEDIVTLSDHRHIVFDVTVRTSQPRQNLVRVHSPRWSLKKLNKDLLIAAAHIEAWQYDSRHSRSGGNFPDPETEANCLKETMTTICDVSMPRCKHASFRSVYWWSEEIAQLRLFVNVMQATPVDPVVSS